MIALKTLVLASVVLAVSIDIPPARTQGPAELPPEVLGFFGRRASCAEWSRKAFDPEWTSRIDSIMDMMQSLKCGDIANDELALRQKYASNPEILAALRASWVKIVKRLPVRIVFPPDLTR